MSELILKPKWANRVAQSLLPLSVEKSDLAGAMREWRYSNRYSEAGSDDEGCELCGHHPILYIFEIRNIFTGHRLWVGSECITKFEIPGDDGQGNALDASSTKSKLARDRRKMIEAARGKRVIRNLIELAAKDHAFDIDNFIGYVKMRGAFTPKQMSFLNWRLSEHHVQHRPRDFKVIIRRNREKRQILEMENWKLRILKPYLSPLQRKWLTKKL